MYGTVILLCRGCSENNSVVSLANTVGVHRWLACSAFIASLLLYNSLNHAAL